MLLVSTADTFTAVHCLSTSSTLRITAICSLKVFTDDCKIKVVVIVALSYVCQVSFHRGVGEGNSCCRLQITHSDLTV